MNDSAPTAANAVPAFTRDAAIVALVALSWVAAEHTFQPSGHPVPLTVGVATGALWIILCHEWGHFAGARLAAARISVAEPLRWSILRFDFPYAANSRTQFLIMTATGHAAHWIALGFAWLVASGPSRSHPELVAGAAGWVAFATLVESPVIVRTLAGADPEAALRRINGINLTLNALAAMGVGLITYRFLG